VKLRHDRIERVQAAMREQGIMAIVVLNHDDYRYLFGEDRAQPRAIVPSRGAAELIVFAAEEPELRAALGDDAGVRIFTSVGGQIHDVVSRLRALEAETAADRAPGERPKVALQMWFHTPAFLVDLFRQVNPQVDVVSSDPVMDPIRAVKDDGELALMTEAQRIAGLGMDVARSLIAPGRSSHEIATEALYAMMRAGAEGTSTPIHVNVGPESCMLHGRLSPKPIEAGDLVVVDLTPQVDGYCANLARTFVAGKPDERQAALIAAYRESIESARAAMKPGANVAALDQVAGEAYRAHGLGDYQVNGIGHGLGLRFEETPASTIIPPHRFVPLAEGMTVTIGHTILAIPGFGGVRFEDVYRVTAGGGVALAPYPIQPAV
jgi:Xaa-Pro aminopeptidase